MRVDIANLRLDNFEAMPPQQILYFGHRVFPVVSAVDTVRGITVINILAPDEAYKVCKPGSVRRGKDQKTAGPQAPFYFRNGEVRIEQ